MILSQFFKACSVSAVLGANRFQLCLFLLMFASRFLVLCCLPLFFFFFSFWFYLFQIMENKDQVCYHESSPHSSQHPPTHTHMNPPLIAPNTHTHPPHTDPKPLPATRTHQGLSPQPPRMFYITIFSLIFTSYDYKQCSQLSLICDDYVSCPFFSSCLLSVSIFFFGLLCFL